VDRRLPDALIAGAVLLILSVMVVPIPTQMIDLLLITSMALALIILLVTLYVRQPVKFSVFPTLLLIATLFRLSLNVASTRSILLRGYGGEVIGSFGNFVVGGNTAVGLVIFLILAIIQFIVITKGAGRIAEVAARFTLDAMPGRQMAIDADLNSGLIDDVEAKERRQQITEQADFYGAMDGASKFVRGDVIAGMIITAINILGGFAVGVLQLGMPFVEALKTFTLLTVGDGLVAQIPALVVSTAAGILVTRAESETDFAREIGGQLTSNPRVFGIAGTMLLILGLIPGLPLLPFAVLAGLVLFLGRAAARSTRRREAAELEAKEQARKAEPPEKVERLLSVDPMEIEVGYALIPLVEENDDGDLLNRITLVRRQTAMDLGVVVPPVRIRDNVRLRPDSYAVKLRGVQIAEGRIMMNHWLAMNPGNIETPIRGFETQDPVFGLPSTWVSEEERNSAEVAGYTVVAPSAVVATHLSEVVKQHAHELLGRQQVQSLIDNIKQEHSVTIDELIPNMMTLGGVQKVLQRLLRERVSIRDLGTILETLADEAPHVKNAVQLTERARQALGRGIAQTYADAKGVLQACTLDLELERTLLSNIVRDDAEPRLILQPEQTQQLLDRAGEAVKVCLTATELPIFICTQGVRPHFYELMSRVFPAVVVLSYQEVQGVESIRSVTTLRLDDENQEVLLANGAPGAGGRAATVR